MLAREKYLEARYFHDQMHKHMDDCEVFKYNLSAFLQAFQSVIYYLQAEFSRDHRFRLWFKQKSAEMERDPVLQPLTRQRHLTVHVRDPRVVGKFTIYVRDPAMAMSEAVRALIKAPDGTFVDVLEPDDLPPEFLEIGHVAREVRQFFFEGY